jgi:serine/threonine-protein kinase
MHYAPGAPIWTAVVTLAARGWLGEVSNEELAAGFKSFLGANNPRWRTLLSQLLVEIHSSWDRVDEAFERLAVCATDVLVDVEWLDRCPLLDCLRGHPNFAPIRRRVAERAAAIWAP